MFRNSDCSKWDGLRAAATPGVQRLYDQIQQLNQRVTRQRYAIHGLKAELKHVKRNYRNLKRRHEVLTVVKESLETDFIKLKRELSPLLIPVGPYSIHL